MMTYSTDSTFSKGLRHSAWLFYCLIVFEILFMISPFALYYYSLYSLPLNWLQQSAYTSWLTLHILPHFSYADSPLINGLLLSAWPLILIGLALFLLGFVQVYWAKIFRRGNVEGGLYGSIRHPQYVALAMVGLGCTIYWSRFLVLIAFVTMLFLYYFLAAHEERDCLAKFPEAYREYRLRTGMFLPKAWTGWVPSINLLPSNGFKRSAAIALCYLVLVAASVLLGWSLKRHVIHHLNLSTDQAMVLVALAPASPERLAEIRAILMQDESFQVQRDRLLPGPTLAYAAPSAWTVPELGLVNPGGHRHASISELLHPATHGNSLDYDENLMTVLLTEPLLTDNDARGKGMLLSALRCVPRLKAEIDLGRREVLSVSAQPDQSRWQGIPVPVY